MKNILATTLAFTLCSCANMNFSNHTVHQGNLSVRKASKNLTLGMNKSTVARIMGTSLISPVFQTNRWDYALTTQKPRQKVSIQSVSLLFNQDKLSKIIEHS